MSLCSRINDKVNQQLKDYLPRPEKVVMGREEYMEFINLFSYSIVCQNRKGCGQIMGLEITRSRRPRYLCVVSKKPRKRTHQVGFYDSIDYWRTPLNGVVI